MDKIIMICDACGKETPVHTSDLKETEAKQPFYRCPKCHIGTMKSKSSTKANNS